MKLHKAPIQVVAVLDQTASCERISLQRTSGDSYQAANAKKIKILSASFCVLVQAPLASSNNSGLK